MVLVPMRVTNHFAKRVSSLLDLELFIALIPILLRFLEVIRCIRAARSNKTAQTGAIKLLP